MTQLTRIEYLARDGWQTGHAGIELHNPERYVERLTERGKFGRATVIETGEVFVSPNLPRDPSKLVDTDTPIPRLPRPGEFNACPVCDDSHRPPYDGSCLL